MTQVESSTGAIGKYVIKYSKKRSVPADTVFKSLCLGVENVFVILCKDSTLRRHPSTDHVHNIAQQMTTNKGHGNNPPTATKRREMLNECGFLESVTPILAVSINSKMAIYSK